MTKSDNITALTEHTKQSRRQRTAPEDALALGFAEKHEGRLRYVAFWNRWLEWDGTRWAADQTLHAYDLIRTFCREVRRTVEAKTINAAHTFARADRRIATTPDAWDNDPETFNQGDNDDH